MTGPTSIAPLAGTFHAGLFPRSPAALPPVPCSSFSAVGGAEALAPEASAGTEERREGSGGGDAAAGEEGGP